MQSSDEYYEGGSLKTRTISNLDNLGRRYTSEIQEFNEDGTYKSTKFLKSVSGKGVVYQEKVYVAGILQSVRYYSVDSGEPVLERIDVFDGKVKVQSIEVYRTIDSEPRLSGIEEFSYYVGQIAIQFYDVDVDGRKTKKQRTYKDATTNEILRIEFYTDGECLSEYSYKDGKKTEMKEFAISEEGERYLKKHTFLDSKGEQERIESYKSAGEGKLIHEETIEFERDANGLSLTMMVYHPYKGGRELTYKQIVKLPENTPELTEWYEDGVIRQDSKISDGGNTKTVTIYKNESGKGIPVRCRVYRSGQLMEDQPIRY